MLKEALSGLGDKLGLFKKTYIINPEREKRSLIISQTSKVFVDLLVEKNIKEIAIYAKMQRGSSIGDPKNKTTRFDTFFAAEIPTNGNSVVYDWPQTEMKGWIENVEEKVLTPCNILTAYNDYLAFEEKYRKILDNNGIKIFEPTNGMSKESIDKMVKNEKPFRSSLNLR